MPIIKLRFPSNRTLGNICVYGAVISVSAVMYMRWRLEDRVKNTEYYRLAMQTLRQHKGAKSLLGEPIKDSGFDLSNDYNNCNAEKAQFEIKVHGSKDKGKVFFWASNNQDKGWLIDRLELETKLQPDKRFLLKKTDQSLDLAENPHTPAEEVPPGVTEPQQTVQMPQTERSFQQPQSVPINEPLQPNAEPAPYVHTAEGGRMQ